MPATAPSSRSAVFTTSRPARSTYAPGLPLEASMALQPGRLADLASPTLEQRPDSSPAMAAGLVGDRSRVLAAVAAHRRADSEVIQSISYASGNWNAAAIANESAADAAEERGLAWAMAGLVLGGVVASGLGTSAALGAVVGLMTGAAIGWTLPVVPATWSLAALKVQR